MEDYSEFHILGEPDKHNRVCKWNEFEQEDKFPYKNLTMKEMAKHISRFIANVWQVHFWVKATYERH